MLFYYECVPTITVLHVTWLPTKRVQMGILYVHEEATETSEKNAQKKLSKRVQAVHFQSFRYMALERQCQHVVTLHQYLCADINSIILIVISSSLRLQKLDNMTTKILNLKILTDRDQSITINITHTTFYNDTRPGKNQAVKNTFIT